MWGPEPRDIVIIYTHPGSVGRALHLEPVPSDSGQGEPLPAPPPPPFEIFLAGSLPLRWRPLLGNILRSTTVLLLPSSAVDSNQEKKPSCKILIFRTS